MASRGSYHNGWSSSAEDEDPEEDREGGARIGRALRSTVVCVASDPQSPRRSSSQSPRHKVLNCNEGRNEDNRRSEQPNTNRHVVSHLRDVEKGKTAVRAFKDSELDRGLPPGRERGAIRFSRRSRERDNDPPVVGVRASDRDMATQRDYPQKDRVRDDGLRREISKRENERLPDEEHIRDQDRSRFGGDTKGEVGGDTKGEEKRIATETVLAPGHYRERSWQKEDGSHSQHDRGHNAPNLRRDRYDSESSDETVADSPRHSPRNGGFRSSRLDDVQDSLKGKVFRGERRKEIDRGREKDRDTGDTSLPELYSIHKATVHSVRPFGLFVRLDGYRKHGLVHVSQVSDHEVVTKRDDADAVKVEALSSVASEGESVWVKVISVKTEEDGTVKVGCSLKYVSQGDGRDLDPNNLQLEKLQTKPAWQAPKKLQLEAVYNVTCSRCGGHGHLKKECYSTGEKLYDLLQDGDDDHDGGGSFKDKGVVASDLSVGQSSRPPSGPVGRGRAMVQPAWMKHGVGVGGDANKVLGRRTSAGAKDVHKDEPPLPEKVTTVQEALAVIAKLKKEKYRKRDEKRERKYLKRSKKYSSKDGKRDKQRKRLSSDDDYKTRKKHRV